DHLAGQADAEACGIGLDADQVGHEPRSLRELDHREDVGRRQRVVPRPAMHHREGVERAAAADPLPLEVRRETVRTGPTGIEMMSAAGTTALQVELVTMRGLPEGTRLGGRNGQRTGVLAHAVAMDFGAESV